MEMLQGVWKQHLRPHAVVGYGVKIFLPSPPNYVTRSPGVGNKSVAISRTPLARLVVTYILAFLWPILFIFLFHRESRVFMYKKFE